MKMNIQKIEGSDFDIEERIDLVLVGAGVKPATEISYKGKTYSEANDRYIISQEEEETLMQTVKGFDIPFVFKSSLMTIEPPIKLDEQVKQIKNKGFQIDADNIRELLESVKDTEYLYFYFGRDIKLAVKLRDVMKLPQSEREYEAGILFGYPETAVRNFVENSVKSGVYTPEELRPIYIPEELRPFSHFVFSKDHAHEELSTPRLWHDTIKELSPRLYAELVNK